METGLMSLDEAVSVVIAPLRHVLLRLHLRRLDSPQGPPVQSEKNM